MDRHRGITLPELVFTLAIAVGLLGWGVPAFRDLQLNASRTREVNQFIQAVYLARSEAIKRNGVVSLCPSLDGESCAPAGTPWQRGWIVFVNLDRDSPAVRDDGEPVLRAYAPWERGAVTANRATLSFRPFGQMGQSPPPSRSATTADPPRPGQSSSARPVRPCVGCRTAARPAVSVNTPLSCI
jgi:type IV fimbrial biogenesis protein FimT